MRIFIVAMLAGLMLAGCSGDGWGNAANADSGDSTPESFASLFGTNLVNAKMEIVSATNLVGRKVGVYFSGYWCPPCRAFTPVLVDFHKKLTKEGKPFEIVFVSSDRSQKDMAAYMKEVKMPWLALPFESERKGALGSKYGVRGVPTLIILDPDGKILSKDGRRDVMELGAKAFDKW